MFEDFPNLGENLDIQIHESHRSPNKVNIKISSSKTHSDKLSTIKGKERHLKEEREKTCKL